MCDCNQKRAVYTAGNQRNSAAERTGKGMVRIRLIQQGPLAVNGDVTGRAYLFRRRNDMEWVDNRDLPGLLKVNGLEMIR